jgi:hypothetical protein
LAIFWVSVNFIAYFRIDLTGLLTGTIFCPMFRLYCLILVVAAQSSLLYSAMIFP